MRRLILHPGAADDISGAADFYGGRQAGLRIRFLTAVQEVFSRIRVNPLLYPLIDGDVRRCLTRSFPFGVIFKVTDGTVLVVAVMHLRRDPEMWKER